MASAEKVSTKSAEKPGAVRSASIKSHHERRGCVLQATGLGKDYGSTVAVQSIDLDVRPGTIVGLVGNNGAGKTTALKMLAGILEPTRGEATLAGRATQVAAVRRDLGYLPEDSPLYDDQTPLAYLAFFGSLYGIGRRQATTRAKELLTALRLDEVHWRKQIGDLSKGSARKVAIARTLLHDPLVLILDEPASGLDPATRRDLDRFLVALRSGGKAILLSAHNLKQVEELCDEIVLLHAGRVAAYGTLADLRKQWGTTRYLLHATAPFPGSRPEGAVHAATLPNLSEAERAMEAVRKAGGTVLDMQSVPPSLDEILQRASGD